MDIPMFLPPELRVMVQSYLEPIDMVVGSLVSRNWKEWFPCQKPERYITTIAAHRGYLEILKWARENGCHWDSYTCSYAARRGHLEVLKWVRKNGCNWDEWTCNSAALGGHLDILKWARENSCGWGKWVFTFAAPGVIWKF